MDTELAYSILEIMQTMEDAAKEMKLKYIAGDIQGFNSLSMDLWDGISAVRDVARQNVPNGSRIRLEDACSCALESLKDIKLLVITNPEKVEWKLEYELMPLIESGAMHVLLLGYCGRTSGERGGIPGFFEEDGYFWASSNTGRTAEI